ncbi:MAG: hypothetical protein HY889_07000 [Deltaproteobacteria bacterium]|nr:hypothetical protein [Deltaproteobacteria bacterium]
MALTFTAMMRVFHTGSKKLIAMEFEKLCDNLLSVKSSDTDCYEKLHQDFCTWFIQEIKTAEKRLKNGRVKASQPASYGHAAKTLDIAMKVYVYYCGQPTLEVANHLTPMLHCAVDTPIMELLKAKFPNAHVTSSTIEQVDKGCYIVLQKLVSKDIAESFANNIIPVQYDDIMWNRLNRNG